MEFQLISIKKKFHKYFVKFKIVDWLGIIILKFIKKNCFKFSYWNDCKIFKILSCKMLQYKNLAAIYFICIKFWTLLNFKLKVHTHVCITTSVLNYISVYLEDS